LSNRRAPRLKERFNYFGGEPNIDESRRRANKSTLPKTPSPARLKGIFCRLAVSQSGRIAAGDGNGGEAKAEPQ
ncbi:hypothetical protein, partial [uncultured Rikenella sp.]|uniref:hypothetical protein n=1 Tax=uncultured Rikenella sp. TaxID=368003 RepID=UPI0026189DCF